MLARFKRPLDDSKDKYAFFLSFIFGISGILCIRIVSETSGDRSLHLLDYLAILWAMAILVVYGAYIVSTRDRSSVSVDRASDNIYYLGLLFTLTSLAYSLIKLSLNFGNSAGSGNGEMILSLLPDFGLALFSTIAGIFGRIFLQQNAE